MTIRFTIPGVPKGKARPRFCRGRVYTPESTRDYEALVRDAYLLVAGSDHFGTRPVAVDVMTFYPIPARATKKARASMESNSVRPFVKPDIDNVLKIIMDGLNGVAWVDDAQVARATCEKRYAVEPMVHVVISDMEAGSNES